MANIIFRMAAWTDAAGKYDPNAPLNGNEDNYYADDDLSDMIPNRVTSDQDVTLSDCGMIMAIADGMGGMNAGEVASQIAHDTVAEFFAPGKITAQLAETHENRRLYMEKVIREADKRIKREARKHPEQGGMGSTLIMAWLVGDELSVTWIGDSRAYRFNSGFGIEPISKDHSYVQELVDKGIITYEQTFDHPQGNIITRSLGDESQDARPESRQIKVHNGDIILLCSDGLSGVLRDRKLHDENAEFYADNIEDIIREHSSSLRECREALWAAAEKAGWYDNVTVVLCEIRNGATTYLASDGNEKLKEDSSFAIEGHSNKTNEYFIIKVSRKNALAILALLIVAVVSVGSYILYNRHYNNKINDLSVLSDSVRMLIKKDSINNENTEKFHPINEKQDTTTTHQLKNNVTTRKDNNQSRTDTVAKPNPRTNEKTITVGQLIKITDSLTKAKAPNGDVLTPITDSE